MDQQAVKTMKSKEEKIQENKNKKRTEKRKMSHQEHNRDHNNKKNRTIERIGTDFNIPEQPGPSREWPRERPVEYPPWSRGQREYRGYQGQYEVPRGQPRGRRPFRRNEPRDFFRGQSRQWSSLLVDPLSLLLNKYIISVIFKYIYIGSGSFQIVFEFSGIGLSYLFYILSDFIVYFILQLLCFLLRFIILVFLTSIQGN